MCLIACFLLYIGHPESFRSNAQNAIAFARRNRQHVIRSDEFACVYLRLRAFVFVCVCNFLIILFKSKKEFNAISLQHIPESTYKNRHTEGEGKVIYDRCYEE